MAAPACPPVPLERLFEEDLLPLRDELAPGLRFGSRHRLTARERHHAERNPHHPPSGHAVHGVKRWTPTLHNPLPLYAPHVLTAPAWDGSIRHPAAGN